MELKKYKLSEVAKVEISSVDKKTKENETLVRLCNFTDVYHNWAITKELSDKFMVASANSNEIEKFSIKKGQVAFTKDSETRDDIGIPTYIADDFDNVLLGYHCALITPTPDESKVSGKYLNAFMHSAYIQKYFENSASGSGQRYTLSLETIEGMPLLLPSIEKQKTIGELFSSLDRKIALNRAINRNLEAFAKQLYDYWFVQFDFPDENGRPYKSSGGKMVWNDVLKHNIPVEWSECDLNYYIGRITNGLNPRKNFVLGSGNNYYVTIRSLVGTDIEWNDCDRCDDEALKKINSRSQLQIGDVIFSAIGTIGRTYFIQEEPNNWNISETSFTLRARENVSPYFFYALLRSEEIQKNADKKAMGSTLRCLVMDSLCKIPTIKVSDKIIERFVERVKPIYKKIYGINKENSLLIKQRDELLPLLMNGQVTIE